MFCYRCGHEISPEDKFCTACGANVMPDAAINLKARAAETARPDANGASSQPAETLPNEPGALAKDMKLSTSHSNTQVNELRVSEPQPRGNEPYIAPTIGWIEAYVDMMYYRPFTMQGRTTRGGFWKAMAMSTVVYLVVSFISHLFTRIYAEKLVETLLTLLCFAQGIPQLFMYGRRLHDIDKSAWYILLHIIPFVGSLVLVIMCLFESKPWATQYGAPVTGVVPKPGVTWKGAKWRAFAPAIIVLVLALLLGQS